MCRVCCLQTGLHMHSYMIMFDYKRIHPSLVPNVWRVVTVHTFPLSWHSLILLSGNKHTWRSCWHPSLGGTLTHHWTPCVSASFWMCVCACVRAHSWAVWGLISQPKPPTQIIRRSNHMLQLLFSGLWQLSVILLTCKHSCGGHGY